MIKENVALLMYTADCIKLLHLRKGFSLNRLFFCIIFSGSIFLMSFRRAVKLAL